MKNLLKLKQVSDEGVISYIQPWINFIHHNQDTSDGKMLRPGSDAIEDWGGKFMCNETNTKYADFHILFETEQHLTHWLLRFT